MATAANGILGGFSGKVGTVVGVKWRDKDVMRSRPKTNNYTPSEKQLAQRSKMGIVSEFLKPLRRITNVHFGQCTAGKSRADHSQSYHLKKAVTGSFPEFSIDYRRVIITKGELPGVHDLQITPSAGGKIQCNWFDNSAYGQAEVDDILLALFYNERKKCFHYFCEAHRNTAFHEIQLPPEWSGDTAHAWFSFISADREMAANSLYSGSVDCL